MAYPDPKMKTADTDNSSNPATADLLTIARDGSVPSTRIKNANQVREIYEKAVRDNELRSKQNALVKGLVDGNPPYEQAKLDQAGQKYRANFNNGEAEAFLNLAKDAFYDLFSEVPTKATITIEAEVPEAVEIGEKITQHFGWLLDQDDSFDFTMQVSHHDMVLYGMGPVIWEDGMDWRVKRASAVNVYLPMHCPALAADWPWVIIYRKMAVGDLYKFISNEEAAKKVGWNPQAVKDAIIKSGDRDNGRSRDWRKWETWQQAFRDGDIWLNETGRMVGVVQMLFQEFSKDGAPPKISEIWVADSTNQEDDWLFRKENAHDDMRQAINPFFYDRGDGSAHGVRGLGRKMYKMLMTKMRLQNATVDSAFARAAIMVKSLGSQSQNSMSPVSLGPYTVLPSGFEVIQSHQAAGLIDAPLAVGRDLDNTLASNLGQYRQRVDKTEGNPRTAFEIAQNISQASNLAKTQIARYYDQLDEMYAEMFRRAANPDIPKSSKNKWYKLAVAFQERCLRDGVNPQYFQFVKVQATRTVGQGSAVMRIGMLNQILMSLGGMLPEDGKLRLTRDLIAAQAGESMVNRYLPQPQARTYEASQKWEAQVENGILKQGGNVTLTPLQQDVIHLQEHISFASQAAASVQQGGDPHDAWLAMQATGQHSAMHLQRLSQNPQRQREYKAILQQFQQLAKVTDQLQELAANNPKGADGQPQMTAEEQIKAGKVKADLALKAHKQQATLGMKAQKQKFDQAMTLNKTNFDQAIADAKTAAEIRKITMDHSLKKAELESYHAIGMASATSSDSE
jgi:hypothetical protein